MYQFEKTCKTESILKYTTFLKTILLSIPWMKVIWFCRVHGRNQAENKKFWKIPTSEENVRPVLWTSYQRKTDLNWPNPSPKLAVKNWDNLWKKHHFIVSFVKYLKGLWCYTQGGQFLKGTVQRQLTRVESGINR